MCVCVCVGVCYERDRTRLACVSGWIVSHVTCVCAYNDTDVFDAGGIYREAGREARRALDGKKGCVSTQQEARCSIYTSENGISEDTALRVISSN